MDSDYGVVIMGQPLQQFTRIVWWMYRVCHKFTITTHPVEQRQAVSDLHTKPAVLGWDAACIGIIIDKNYKRNSVTTHTL